MLVLKLVEVAVVSQFTVQWQSTCQALTQGPSHRPLPSMPPVYMEAAFERRLQELLRASGGKGCPLLVFGDSDVSRWPSPAPRMPPLTQWLGVSGALLSDCAKFLPRALRLLRPQRVVVLAGENDLAEGAAVEKVVKVAETLARTALAAQATTHLFLVGCKPEPATRTLYRLYRRFNKALATLVGLLNDGEGGREGGVTFGVCDVYAAFASTGVDASLYALDGLHLSAAGYALLEKELCGVLEQWKPPSQPVKQPVTEPVEAPANVEKLEVLEAGTDAVEVRRLRPGEEAAASAIINEAYTQGDSWYKRAEFRNRVDAGGATVMQFMRDMQAGTAVALVAAERVAVEQQGSGGGAVIMGFVHGAVSWEPSAEEHRYGSTFTMLSVPDRFGGKGLGRKLVAAVEVWLKAAHASQNQKPSPSVDKAAASGAEDNEGEGKGEEQEDASKGAVVVTIDVTKTLGNRRRNLVGWYESMGYRAVTEPAPVYWSFAVELAYAGKVLAVRMQKRLPVHSAAAAV